jgi:hypothetical protein
VVSSPLERSVTALLEGAGNQMWGFTPRLMAPTVRQLGPVGALRWFAANMPRYLLTLRVYGALRTHLVGTVISLLNGCPYCTYGEAYAFQLIYLRDSGRLFPLDEFEMGELCGQSPASIRRRLVAALQLAGMHAEVPVLDRVIELTLGPDQRPSEPEEIRLAHLVRMLSTMNAISMRNGMPRAAGAAMDPVNKDSALKLLYAGLRNTAPCT